MTALLLWLALSVLVAILFGAVAHEPESNDRADTKHGKNLPP